MNIEGLYFRPVVGGPAHGLYVISLELGGADAPSFSLSEIVTHIQKAVKAYRVPTVRITVPWQFEQQDEVEELVAVLKGSVALAALTWGYDYPKWLAQVAHITANVDENEWLMFPVHEIHFVPNEPDRLKIPELGQANEKNAAKVLLLNKRIDERKVIEFARQTAGSWLIVTPSPVEYVVKIL